MSKAHGLAPGRDAARYEKRGGAVLPSACLMLQLEQRQDMSPQWGLEHQVCTRAPLQLHHRTQTLSAWAVRMALLISDGQNPCMRACEASKCEKGAQQRHVFNLMHQRYQRGSPAAYSSLCLSQSTSPCRHVPEWIDIASEQYSACHHNPNSRVHGTLGIRKDPLKCCSSS